MDMNGMRCMDVQGMGWMMGGMGIIGVLLFIALILSIAALIKYLFLGRKNPD